VQSMRFSKIILELLRKLSSKSVYYISGPETLPPPLDKEEEAKMLSISHTDEAARKTLIEHNLRLVVFIAKRFENSGINIEDLISIGTIGYVFGRNKRSDSNHVRL